LGIEHKPFAASARHAGGETNAQVQHEIGCGKNTALIRQSFSATSWLPEVNDDFLLYISIGRRSWHLDL